MKGKIAVCILILLKAHSSVFGQEENVYRLYRNPKAAEKEFLMPPLERLNYKLFNELNFSYQFNETCDAVFTTIVLKVRNNKLEDSLTYEENCPEAIKKAFKHVIPIFQEQKWRKIFPEVKDKSDYDIVLPFAYSFQVPGCWDTIPAKTIEWGTQQAMGKRKNNQIKSYCLPPLRISRLH